MPLRPLLPLIRLCAATAACLLLVDALLFRSGWYFLAARPDSTAGSVFNARLGIRHYYEPARKNILVLGNSRIGEGFSAQTADAVSPRPDLHFINGSVAGTSPRVWYYLLRAVDPDADRFAAIAMMVDYDVGDIRLDMRNYALDTSYATSLLRLADITEYPNTFTDNAERERARRAIALPLSAMHEDVRDLITHPADRYRQLHGFRKGWLQAIGNYPGRDGHLPSLDIDRITHEPKDWNEVPAELGAGLHGYFSDLGNPVSTERKADNAGYLRQWLERIANRYAAHNIPVIVFVVPRGPWHRQLAAVPQPSGPVAELAAAGKVIALPGDAFVELEQPQFFFDASHMNHDGREEFSRRFAARVAPLVR
jgi:hypothetical protein